MPTRVSIGRTRSLLPGVLYLLTGEQQLHLPCRPAAELRRTQRRESHLRLHRNPQEVRPVRTEIPMHDRTVSVSCNPHERSSSAASARPPNYTGVRTGTATAKEGRGALCRTKESQSHRPQSAPAPQVEVRTRAVLPGGHCPEHQAASPVPQPTNDVTGSRYFIGQGPSRLTQLQSSIPEPPERGRLFQHPQGKALIELAE